MQLVSPDLPAWTLRSSGDVAVADPADTHPTQPF
jgi:hypothetical protein